MGTSYESVLIDIADLTAQAIGQADYIQRMLKAGQVSEAQAQMAELFEKLCAIERVAGGPNADGS
jgi:hypothetical protein